ncbi:hypothetical protein [Streptomyces chiangmaiensis]|uniref:DUF2933 domain-containing protein n=1 Tax=Streptomyces chiangmaiensis TaxID=766497 RepID=A0ABU7FPR9_9ACTN|nr:hypothetical protein [Streptomyces chiangmaiensis]MED7825423.1 hypothetical protein [Streptomyces chiangmaiensis]
MNPKLLTGIAVAAVVAVVLLRLGVPPYVLLLIALVAACPLGIAFIRGGQGGHGGGPHEREGEENPEHDHGDRGGTGLTKKGPPRH